MDSQGRPESHGPSRLQCPDFRGTQGLGGAPSAGAGVAAWRMPLKVAASPHWVPRSQKGTLGLHRMSPRPGREASQSELGASAAGCLLTSPEQLKVSLLSGSGGVSQHIIAGLLPLGHSPLAPAPPCRPLPARRGHPDAAGAPVPSPVCAWVGCLSFRLWLPRPALSA